MALAPQESMKRIFTTHTPPPPKLALLSLSKGRLGVATCQGQFPCQTQWMGTNAWHSVETDLPTATLATIDSEGSVRGESSITRSKHRNAMTYHTTLPRAAAANISSRKLQTKKMTIILRTSQ